jgi:EAL domain-containing protein (putative c-di-GMP-specific phosphodiesterase class I)
VKVDRYFVSGIADPGPDRVLVETIVRLNHALGLEVVAEGVEGPAQLRVLAELGVDAVQGFRLSAAVPREIVLARRAFDLGRLGV